MYMPYMTLCTLFLLLMVNKNTIDLEKK